jgi:hypothetical protein
MDIIHFQKLQLGRKRYQLERTKKRLELEASLNDQGILEVGLLSRRELFLTGIVLYWAEGFKHKKESGLGLATMDPDMARLYLLWLEKCLGVQRCNLSLRVTANEAYKSKITRMENFWAKTLKVNRTQFSKPFYQQVKQKRKYPNSDNYNGVIRIRVRKSLNLLRKMRGWIQGVSNSGTYQGRLD